MAKSLRSLWQGGNCPYRHEPAALGHERVCRKWIDGQCIDIACTDRHMYIEVSYMMLKL